MSVQGKGLPCLDRNEKDACEGPAIVLCEHHHDARLNRDAKFFEKAGRDKERDRIVMMLSERAGVEFMAGREENARLFRGLVEAIRKEGS